MLTLLARHAFKRGKISPRTGITEIHGHVDHGSDGHDELEDLPARGEVASKPEAVQHERRFHHKYEGEGVVEDVLGGQLPIRRMRVICCVWC